LNARTSALLLGTLTPVDVRAKVQPDYRNLRTELDKTTADLEQARQTYDVLRQEAQFKVGRFARDIAWVLLKLIAFIWVIGLLIELLWLGVDIAANVQQVREHFDHAESDGLPPSRKLEPVDL
jgi:hypothetical protein